MILARRVGATGAILEPATSAEVLLAKAGRLARSQRALLAFLLVLGAVPLLWPAVPPLTDLPNHMSRYRIGLDYATSPYFRQWFDFHWVLVGNLGVDLLAAGLAPLMGLEHATKLVVIAIPVLTIAGLCLIAREVHGRLSPLIGFAAAFAYNWPLNFGFVNYALASALALIAFGFWLRLGRLGRPRLRAALFVPIGFLVWLAHAAGWGMLGVLVFTWEIADARRQGVRWADAGTRAFVACLPLALPLLPMIGWSNALPHGSLGRFDLRPGRKLAILLLALRNGNPTLDMASALLALIAATVAIARPDLRYDRRLTFVAAAMLLVLIVMPADLMGSGHADVRVGPYVAMLFLVALRPGAETSFTRALGAAALLFFAGRIAAHTIRYAGIGQAQEAQLEALDHLPTGARVFAFAGVTCPADMEGDRMDHVNRMAIVRRQAFTNGTWPYPASQTLIVHPAMVAGYADESSQLLQPIDCRRGARHTVPGALAALPPGRFQYFWMLDVPKRLWPTRSWLQPVWHGERGILYRILTPAEARSPDRNRVIARRLA